MPSGPSTLVRTVSREVGRGEDGARLAAAGAPAYRQDVSYRYINTMQLAETFPAKDETYRTPGGEP